MTTIKLETRMAAPAMRVFLLSLNVDLHKASTAKTNEEAIAGVTTGILCAGDSVTWRARHFGLRLTHTAKITGYRSPDHFVDTMTKGAFHTFVHTHSFEQRDEQHTIMRDELVFASPLGPLGAMVDAMVLKRYLTRFLCERNALIRTVAESEDWRRFLPSAV
jgi:ligand-binding SRPBCC domain-containing protein